MKSRAIKVCLTLLLTITLVACSFSSGEVNNGRPAEHPDMELIKSRYLFSKEDIRPIEIEADKIELYKDYDKAYITSGSFRQHDSEGEPLFTGSFSEAEIDTDSNNLEMRGAVEIENQQENFTIYGEHLTWNNSDKIVTSEGDTLVTLIKDGHDILEGVGFTGYLESSTFEFLRMERGHLHYD